MTNKKSVKKNYIYNLIYQIITIVVPLVTMPYLSRVLGAENVGVFSYTLSIVTYFVLLGSLGVSAYGRREIAYVGKDVNKRSRVFWEIVLIRCVTVAISIALFLVTVFLIGQYEVYFIILSLELFATIFDISWFFQGIEDFRITILRVLIVKVLSAVFIFLFVQSQADLWIYALIYALSTLLGNISLWLYLPKYVEKIKFHLLRFKKHLKPIFVLFLPQVASQIYVVLDKVMIGAIIEDKVQLGYYEQGEKIIKLLLTIITALSSVIVPKIASAYIEEDEAKIWHYMKKTFCFTYLLSLPMIFGIIVVADKFVPVFFGEGYGGVAIIMKMLSPIILIIGFGSAIGIQYLIPTKRQNELTVSYVLGALTDVVMNALLISKFGAVGAVIGTIMAELCVTGVQFCFIRREFGFVKILKLSWKYFVASVLMSVICYFVNQLLGNGFLSICGVVIVGIVSYATTLLILREELVTDIVGKLFHRRIIKKKNI